MGKRKDAFDFTADDDEQDALIRIGKQLLALPKSKDALSKLLKKAGPALEQIPQGSEGAKLAIGDLSKALGKRELVKHKDKEVRLYTAFCLTHVLRIYAPDTPYTDDELKEIFGLFNSVYAELEDQSGAHFQLCLSVLETVSQVKCSILLLDLDADDLVCELFSNVFGAINDDNQGMLESSALELLSSMLEESDVLSQQLLDVILVNLLPTIQQEHGAACRLAQKLLQRTEACVQPYLQKFLTNALLGMRTESDLKDDCHGLIFQLYQAVPQVLLPVLPHLSLELQVEVESKRLAAVDLLGKLFSRPDSGDILKEYAELFQDLLKRLHDQKVDVRLRVLSFCKGLLDNCSDAGMRRYIIQGILDRLLDVDDRVRSTAACAFCDIMGEHPNLAATGLDPVLGRLRDKKVAVRKEVASQVAGLVRTWCMKVHQNVAGAPKMQQVIAPLLVLCNLATRDADLGSYVTDTLFKGGIFPNKLPLDVQVQWWTFMWQRAGEVGKASFAKLLKNKNNLQRQVRDLIQLRSAAKEQRQAGGGATSSLAASGTGSDMQPSNSTVSAIADPERVLQARMHLLAKALHDVSRAEEGLQKLWEMKDNHIFGGLGTLAAHGTSMERATEVGKDLLQRVGSKGTAAEVARALVNRMTPSLLSPELLQTAMEHAGESEEAQAFLMDVAIIAPQLFAQSLDPIVSMLEQDDPLLASCAAKVLAKAGRYFAAANHMKHESDQHWEELLGKVEGTLINMCSGTSPSGAKAAVCALVTLMGPERAATTLKQTCETVMDVMKRPSTINHHPKLLTAIKMLSTVGRTLPQLFAEYADEFTDFILDQLLKEDLSSGKPLRAVTETTGDEWGRPSPGIEVKAAALKALAQSLVPDNSKIQLSKEVTNAVDVILAKLVELVNPDEESPEFESIGLEGSVDAAWVRCAAGSSMLRLARAHDHSLNTEVYVELALSLQDPHPDARRRLVGRVVKTVEYFHASPQRAAKYAALLGLLAVDPVDGNQSAAFKSLREYVAFRRRQLQASAQTTAEAGGGGNMIQAMPEFILPFLIFILAHHPDYPGTEELQEWEDMDKDEREEMEEAGQRSPLAPFQTMLQFVLEPLIFSPDTPINPAEIAQAIPATLKLLRTLKFCEDAAPEGQQRNENVYQLCDIAMALMKAMVDRATKGKTIEPGRFPGSVVLPRMCFKPKDMRNEVKKADGSHLPLNFTPLLTDDFFSQRFANMALPASAKKPRYRSKVARSGSHNGQQQPAGSLGRDDEQPGGDDASTQPTSEEGPEQQDEAPGSNSKLKNDVKRIGSDEQQQPEKRSRKPARQKQLSGDPHNDAAANDEELTAAASKRKRASPGTTRQKRRKAEPQQSSPATRQQPRRGAKAVAAAKLRADTSDEEEEEDEYAGAGPSSHPAADDPMSQSDFENASMGSPAPGPSSAAQALTCQHKSGLRAGTDDEDESQPVDLDPGGRRTQRQQEACRKAANGKGAGDNKVAAAKVHPAAKGAKATKAHPAAALKPKSKNIRV